MSSPKELVGLTWFHRLTIFCGTVFTLLVAYRFLERWRATGELRALLTSIGFLVGGIALAAYLRRFLAKGI